MSNCTAGLSETTQWGGKEKTPRQDNIARPFSLINYGVNHHFSRSSGGLDRLGNATNNWSTRRKKAGAIGDHAGKPSN
jgi:hypothetical protein